MRTFYTLSVNKKADKLSACMDAYNSTRTSWAKEIRRYTFTRPGTVVTCIVYDDTIDLETCKRVCVSFFEQKHEWIEVDLHVKR